VKSDKLPTPHRARSPESLVHEEAIAVNGPASSGVGELRFFRRWILAVAALALTSCNPDQTLTQANVDQITTGMAKKQVESILGLPTVTETQDFDVNKKITYIYRQGKDTVTMVFWDDKLESKTGSLSK